MSQFVLPRFILPRNQAMLLARWGMLASLLVALTGCGILPKADAEAQPRGQQQGGPDAGPAAVDVAIARVGAVRTTAEYTGTTRPVREVSLRSQAEGQLLDLAVDVGDAVTQGQTLGQLDDNVLTATVIEAQAEVAARESEVAQARTTVSDAQTQVDRARLELQQRQSDLARLEQLFKEGALPAQQVEQARTAVGTAQQAVRSAQEQVRTRQQAIVAAQRRVNAQQAVVAQEAERRSYAVLTSPVTGSVLERVTEPGNLVQPGSEILRLGDFNQVKVAVQVSELELGNIRLGQSAQVRLDAFPNQQFVGRVSRISPAADATARLIPIEVTIANPDGRIGSGLLARVSFNQQLNQQRVLVPETALKANEDPKRRNQRQGQSAGQDGRSSSETRQQQRQTGLVFVVNNTGEQPKVAARSVTLGKRSNGQVEILAGLTKGESFVARSSKALKDGDSVRLSVLSDKSDQAQQN